MTSPITTCALVHVSAPKMLIISRFANKEESDWWAAYRVLLPSSRGLALGVPVCTDLPDFAAICRARRSALSR